VAQPVFKHQDDDGDLSIFASGDVVVLACEHGHYWLVDAKQHTDDSIKPALEKSLTRAEAIEMFKAL
jgi:hypothetical protein